MHSINNLSGLGRFVFSVTCFFVVCVAQAQNARIDSLKALLATSKADTHRVNLLNELGKAYFKISPDTVRLLGQQQRQLAQRLKFDLGIANATNNIGLSYYFQGDYAKAFTFYDKALAIYTALKNEVGISTIYNNRGIAYRKQGNYVKAIKYYQKGLALQEKNKALRLMSFSYNNIGIIYANQKNYPKALEYHKKALVLKKKLGNRRGVATSFNNIGSIYNRTKEYEQALYYFKKALLVNESLYLKMPLYYINIGSAFLHLNKLDSADYYNQQGLELAYRLGDKPHQTRALIKLAQAYYARKKYTIAIDTAKKAMKLARQTNIAIQVKKASEVLYLSYKKRNNYSEAFNYQTLFMQTQDSLLNKEKNKQLLEIETRYETEKKEQEISLKNKQIALLKKEKQHEQLFKYTFVGAFISLAIIGGLVIVLLRLRVRKNRKLYETEKSLAQAKLTEKRLLNDNLAKELDLKNQRLTSQALHIIQKNETLEKIQVSVKLMQKEKGNTADNLAQLVRLVDSSLRLDKDWENFFGLFLDVHQGFFDKLELLCSSMSNAEMRLCALVKLKFTSKEIASILGITHGSTSVARHRIRKKLSVPKEQKLSDFIANI